MTLPLLVQQVPLQLPMSVIIMTTMVGILQALQLPVLLLPPRDIMTIRIRTVTVLQLRKQVHPPQVLPVLRQAQIP